MSYLSVILSACAVFPSLALLFTIPYIIYEYHKYGSINKLRVLIVYSFILYLLVAYFLIILPLPSIESVKQMTGPKAQLIPFMFIKDIIDKVPLSLRFFTYREVYQVLFNYLLTVPFGIYLRYYFKLDFKKTLLYSFLLSLFFELTQLSGLYFIYPRPYRLFDVDDLMINTLGGITGYGIAKLFVKILPSRNQIDLQSYKDGRKISVLRKATMFCLDLFFIMLLGLIVLMIFSLFNKSKYFTSQMVVTLLIYYVLFPSIRKVKGQTFGGKILNIKIVDDIGFDCKLYQYLIRYFILYLFVIGLPILIIIITTMFCKFLPKEYIFMFIIMELLLLFVLFVYLFIKIIFKKEKMLYEKISKTKLVSTIVVPNNLKES